MSQAANAFGVKGGGGGVKGGVGDEGGGGEGGGGEGESEGGGGVGGGGAGGGGEGEVEGGGVVGGGGRVGGGDAGGETHARSNSLVSLAREVPTHSSLAGKQQPFDSTTTSSAQPPKPTHAALHWSRVSWQKRQPLPSCFQFVP